MKLFIKTFTRREYTSILGKRRANFYILLLVFLCSIGALEFSRSGIKYLNHKMDDPFINWVDVRQQGKFETLLSDAKDTSLLKHFHIDDVEENNYLLDYVFTRQHKKVRIEGRTFVPGSRLMEKILDDDNVVVRRSRAVDEDDYGWIITQDLLSRLGYAADKDSVPMFANYTFRGDRTNIESWGLEAYDDDYIVVPIPIIAVVKQLPDLLDYMAPSHFLEQYNDDGRPFNISMHESYFRDLYFAMADTAGAARRIAASLMKSGVEYDPDMVFERYDAAHLMAWRVRIVMRDSIAGNVNAAARQVSADQGNYYRIFDYDMGAGYKLRTNYISLMFNDLSKVGEFAAWVKNEYDIRIDMAQIDAKNNFNTFNLLSSVLCVAIIILSLLFLAIFLWFLIDSHFRAISKNLGTIMAFGLPNRTIINIYLRLFLRLVATSLLVAVGGLVVIQVLLLLLGVMRDGGFQYISIIDPVVVATTLLLPIMTTAVVVATMQRKLHANPGDLIFERIKKIEPKLF